MDTAAASATSSWGGAGGGGPPPPPRRPPDPGGQKGDAQRAEMLPGVFAVHGSEAGGEVERVALAQRNFQLLAEALDHVPAGLR
ncbi:hypothetical protein, partial [Nocardia wallacei]|uniref:hypothetical protein n=1 Tax=Nocardia wallacei TaxID=480035 RepID=UPI0024551648